MNLSQPIHVPKLEQNSPRSPRRNMHLTAARASCREYLSSTMRLGPTRDAWQSLSEALHNFSRECFLDEALPDLLHEFTRVEKSYEDFQRQAQTIFNNSRPSKSVVGIRPTAAIEKKCLEMMGLWAIFYKTFVKARRVGVTHIFQFMSEKFTFISSMMASFEKAYDEPQPLIGIGMVRKAQAVMADIRFKSNQLCSMVKFYNPETFDPEMFGKYLDALSEGVKYLFAQLIPRNSAKIGSVVATKRDLIVACDDLVKMFEGTNHFDEQVEVVWSAMDVMNEAFDNLFAMLNLKERTRTYVGGIGMDDEPEKRPKKQTVNESMLSVERIQDHMCDIENVLSDTSRLFKKK